MHIFKIDTHDKMRGNSIYVAFSNERNYLYNEVVQN